MPRRRFRLTMKRPKKQSRNPPRTLSDDYGTPTDEEWCAGESFNVFVVKDNEDEEYSFRKGDVALILPRDIGPKETEGMEDNEYWIGKVRGIRALGSEEDVWAKVQWYYTPEDVACIIKSFDTSTCGHYERIFSDHFDYIHVDSFSGVTSMTRFGMNDDRQKFIGRKDFYCRHDFEHKARRILPRQKAQACRVCSQPYSPDDSDRRSLMHFCPRPSCRKFYHESCLEIHKGLTEGSRTLQLIMTWPDEDKKDTIFSLLSYTGQNDDQSDASPQEVSMIIS
ncbi:hypothetical protein F5887DRAFT_9118 [Amanita rubescens]|nr:hypothetical protein F5887DRAFT_9118 [Amanita rubescens]